MKKKQKGFFYPLLAIPTIVFLVAVGVGWKVYQNNTKNNQAAPTAEVATEKDSQPAAEGNQAAPENPAPKPKTNNQPVGNSKPKSEESAKPAGKYLEIEEWGIKIKYTKEGSYKLKYYIDDDAVLYITTDKLEEFAIGHPECSDADRGTILNRIKPGGYDYNGRQWSEESLKGIQAVKIHGYYYSKIAQYVCSGEMPNVSFDTQQEYINLSQKIPWHDAVELK